MRIVPSSRFWSLHTHSQFSNGDALPKVENIVKRAAELRYRAIGLTDHGNIAGSVQLYKEATKHGLKAFPGSELYYVPSVEGYAADRKNKDVKSSWFHLGVHAYTTEGYTNLVNLSTLTHRQHHYKPLADAALLADLAQSGRLRGLAVSTGCHFGLAVQTLIKRGPEAAARWIAALDSWFPLVYVELQQHEIEHDDHPGWNDHRVAKEMHSVAQQMGLPVILTQDSHYVYRGEREAHETLKKLSSWSDTPDDATFPGDGFHMVGDEWMADHFPADILEDGLAGLDDLYDHHTLEIPVLDNYSYSVPKTVKDPEAEMEKRVMDFIVERDLPIEYLEKAREEIDVINTSGMAAYMILVAYITDYCREQGWLFQTRGSAAGSLVAWALGITQVDPIHWDLRFERFLSKDRTKPPDIDLDVQHDKRQLLIDWLRTQFFVTAIGTWMRMSMEPDEENEGKGSIMVKYYQMSAKEDGPDEWEKIPEETKDALYLLNRQNAYTGMGKNAAGVIITNNPDDVEKLVPIHHSSTVTEGVSQYGKDDIEALGLVKLDILGSKTLTVLSRAAALMDKNVEELLPIERITSQMRSDSRVVYADVAKGKTAGVFQLEGWSTQKGCKELKPTNVHDLIAAMALFRPAVMDSGAKDHYIERKHKRENRNPRHQIIEDVVGPTYGIILYQEQVIDLLRALEMEADDLTAFLKAVKASNKDIGNAQQVIDSYMPWIEKRCQEVGMDEHDWQFIRQAFDAFGGYSFNRAHSTIYGLTAWRCAYLAHHHPLEFHTALLDVASEGADRKKEQRYVSAARGRGIRVSRPDINVSGAGYTIDEKHKLIRKGLTSVLNVGMSAARELVVKRPEGGYESIEQIIDLVDPSRCSGGKNFIAQAKRAAKKPDIHEPPTYEMLNGNLGALFKAEVLESLIGES